ncbi:MAG: hypothetical protein NUW37_06035 [Planctomycetes bacterium]|nr:hypothetical protein [Planctomycetota bacterium]
MENNSTAKRLFQGLFALVSFAIVFAFPAPAKATGFDLDITGSDITVSDERADYDDSLNLEKSFSLELRHSLHMRSQHGESTVASDGSGFTSVSWPTFGDHPFTVERPMRRWELRIYYGGIMAAPKSLTLGLWQNGLPVITKSNEFHIGGANKDMADLWESGSTVGTGLSYGLSHWMYVGGELAWHTFVGQTVNIGKKGTLQTPRVEHFAIMGHVRVQWPWPITAEEENKGKDFQGFAPYLSASFGPGVFMESDETSVVQNSVLKTFKTKMTITPSSILAMGMIWRGDWGGYLEAAWGTTGKPETGGTLASNLDPLTFVMFKIGFHFYF